MKHLILLYLFLLMFSHEAIAADDTATQAQAIKDYCLPPIGKDIPPADFASSLGLVEMSPEEAPAYTASGARVFIIPDSKENILLIAEKGTKPVCSLAVLETNAALLWQELDKTFPPESPFKFQKEKRIESQNLTRRTYEADINGPITILISISDTARPGGVQALFTLARHK